MAHWFHPSPLCFAVHSALFLGTAASSCYVFTLPGHSSEIQEWLFWCAGLWKSLSALMSISGTVNWIKPNVKCGLWFLFSFCIPSLFLLLMLIFNFKHWFLAMFWGFFYTCNERYRLRTGCDDIICPPVFPEGTVWVASCLSRLGCPAVRRSYPAILLHGGEVCMPVWITWNLV